MDEKPAQAPPEDLEVTQAVSAQPDGSEPTTQIDPEELDRRMAQELARRGVAPDEVQRLVALGRGELPPPPKKKGAAALVSPPEIPPSEAFKPKPNILLPEFRESTAQERIDADRLLTSANISRRRGLYKQAEKECREALDLVPADAAALELYGDILQGSGRVDDAVFAYEQATKADPKRKSAEKKFAELTLMQNREIELLREEFIPKSTSVAILLSTVFPGAGQFYNGEMVKGVIIAAAFIACVAMISGSTHGIVQGAASTKHLTLLGAVLIIYLFAIVDAFAAAKRGGKRKSGWEV